MKRAQTLSILRHVLSAVGGLMTAYGFGHDTVLSSIIGISLSVLSIYLSVKNKDLTANKIEGAVRQLLTSLGGFMCFKTFLTPDTMNTLTSTLVTLLPLILGQLDKKTTETLVTNGEENEAI